MTRQQAIEELNVSLTRTIEKWSESVCETPAWESLNFYVGPDTDHLMARAALAVLEGVAEVQEYQRSENMLEN